MSARAKRAFLVAAVIAVGATGLTSCAGSGGGDDTYSLTAILPRAISLYPASEVRVLGLPAGRVGNVRVDGTEVRVELRIKKSVPVPANVHAMVQPLSLIGERYVQLSPVWTEGQPRAKNGHVIGRDRTDIPVEPDEALAALKKFLDALDPKATGSLITNLAADLDGNGQRLNDALKGVSDLVATLADKDETLVRLIDNFDDFTATLRTRESQLGQTMELFATTTGLLAQERRTIESLIANLSDVSTSAFDLVSEHRARLDRDLTILTRLLQSVRTNLDSVEKVLDSGPLLVTGIKGAYSEQYHRIDLRTQFSPTVAQALMALGVPPVNLPCVPVDVSCPVGTSAAPAAASAPGERTSAATTAGPGSTPAAPIDDIVALLGSPSNSGATSSAQNASPAVRVGRAAGGFAGFLRRTMRFLLGVGS